MQISEKAMDNTHEIFNQIRTQCVQASNGTLGVDDRQKILETVRQLKKQIVQESNANYAGRNVFGGYKTDKKVLFDKDAVMTPPAQFEQTFKKDDIEIVSYKGQEYYRIRLPYGDIDAGGFSATDAGIHLVAAGGMVNSTTPPPAVTDSYYHPVGVGKANLLKDTGELIINKDTYDAMTATSEIKITYQKTNFKVGDPNPELFFDIKPPTPPATDPLDPPIYMDGKPSQRIEYEIGIGTKIDINVLGKDLFNPLSLRDIDELINVLESYETIEADINDIPAKRDPKEAINLSMLFSSGIGRMDEALHAVSSQQADLGSRVKRLELTEKRLADDEISYTELLSRTEDVELERAYIDFNTQYAVYQSALQVTAKVVQPTLMDFLR
ncbi:MAG TPA: hypothetical protein GX707_01980, partial [Epulopiscium sp.]|nr:hypothetical protein [Candidatus Epulonipiscium sp.]